MINPREIYDLMLDVVSTDDAIIEDLKIGLTWTYCRSESTGLCMTADTRSRTFPWSGSLNGKRVSQIAPWILEWDAMQSSIALSAINSIINANTKKKRKSLPISPNTSSNLSVFNYFLSSIKDKNCVVVGRYPGLDKLQEQYNLKVIEFNPGLMDHPATASEFLLPEAEWVFLTGTSIANKTFPRLMELSQNATVVLMGPSVPQLDELSLFGVDFIAGVDVVNDAKLQQLVSEAAGVHIFQEAVQYSILDLSRTKMEETKNKISHTVKRRDRLKKEMETWYSDLRAGKFPKTCELVALDEELSLLDSQYKQLWDTRQNLAK